MAPSIVHRDGHVSASLLLEHRPYRGDMQILSIRLTTFVGIIVLRKVSDQVSTAILVLLPGSPAGHPTRDYQQTTLLSKSRLRVFGLTSRYIPGSVIYLTCGQRDMTIPRGSGRSSPCQRQFPIRAVAHEGSYPVTSPKSLICTISPAKHRV